MMKFTFLIVLIIMALPSFAQRYPTTGGVTSVDMTVPPFLSVTGNPITGGGTLVVDYSGAPITMANGTYTAPSYSFTNASDTGLYLSATSPKTLTFAAGGAPVVDIRGSYLTPSLGSTVSLGSTTNPFNLGYFDTGILLRNRAPIYFYDSVNGSFLSFKAPASVANNVTWTLPGVDGSNGQILKTNGAGILSWVTPSPGTVVSIDVSGGTTGLTTSGGPISSVGTITLGGTLAIGSGGTGATTQQTAINALAGAVTAGQYLRGNGTNILMSAIQAADVPTLNQNTTGTASNVTGVVAIANGGTGQTTANAALNALLPSQGTNNGKFLTTDGSNTSWATVAASPGGSNTQLQYNNSGVFAGTSGAVYSSALGALDLAGANSSSVSAKVGFDGYLNSSGSSMYITNDIYLTSGTWNRTNNYPATVLDLNASGDFTIHKVAAPPGSVTLNEAFRIDSSKNYYFKDASLGSALTNYVWTLQNTTTGQGAWKAVTGGSGTVTSVNVAGGTTGLSFSGGPITTSGTITAGGTLGIANGGTGQTTATAAANALLPTQTTNNTYLKTDGAGNLSWSAVSGGSPAGSNTQIQFNNSGSFAGDSQLTWDNVNKRLSVTPSPTQSYAVLQFGANGFFNTASTGTYSISSQTYLDPGNSWKKSSSSDGWVMDFPSLGLEWYSTTGTAGGAASLTQRWRFTTGGQIQGNNGAAGSPTYTFLNSSTSGLYYTGSGLGFSVGGTNQLTLTSALLAPQTNNTLNLGSNTLRFNNFYTKSIYDKNNSAGTATTQFLGSDGAGGLVWAAPSASVTFPLTGSDGTAAAPTYSFANSTSTGVFSSAVNTLSFAASGVNQLNLTNNNFLPNTTNVMGLGSASKAFSNIYGYTLQGDLSTGEGLKLSAGFGNTALVIQNSGGTPSGNSVTGLHCAINSPSDCGVTAGSDVSSTSAARPLRLEAQNNVSTGAGGAIYLRGGSSTSGNGGGIILQTPGTKPTCSSTTRGMYYNTLGGTGVKDSVEVCAKDATDTYAWRTIY